MGFAQKIFSDLSGEPVEQKKYKGMIWSPFYLTTSRPLTLFSTWLCIWYQVALNMSHLLAVKQIFRYLNGTKSLWFWYLIENGFSLKLYSNSNYGGLHLDRKSTSRGCQFLGGRLVSWSSKNQNYIALSTVGIEYNVATRYTS